MTIREAFKKHQADIYETKTMRNAMFDIDFLNSDGESDETQFTVKGEHTSQEIERELNAYFKEFCKENGFDRSSVVSITYLGPDPFYK